MRLSQPTETVRVPVSSLPMVCGVVGGSHLRATSSSVIPRARRTSQIRVIIFRSSQFYEPKWFSSVLQICRCGKRCDLGEERDADGNEIISERSIERAFELRLMRVGRSVGYRQRGQIAAWLAVCARTRDSAAVRCRGAASLPIGSGHSSHRASRWPGMPRRLRTGAADRRRSHDLTAHRSMPGAASMTPWQARVPA